MKCGIMNSCLFEGMFDRTIYVKTAGSYEIWAFSNLTRLQEFFSSRDNCVALSEQSEFAKAVIHRRTKNFGNASGLQLIKIVTPGVLSLYYSLIIPSS